MISGGGLQFLTVTGTPRDPSDQCDQPDELAQKGPKMGQDHADVVAAAAQNGKEGGAGRSLQRASGQASIGLRVTDHQLYTWLDAAKDTLAIRKTMTLTLPPVTCSPCPTSAKAW